MKEFFLKLCLQIEIWFETNDVNIQEQHNFITHTIDQNYLAIISNWFHPHPFFLIN